MGSYTLRAHIKDQQNIRRTCVHRMLNTTRGFTNKIWSRTMNEPLYSNAHVNRIKYDVWGSIRSQPCVRISFHRLRIHAPSSLHKTNNENIIKICGASTSSSAHNGNNSLESSTITVWRPQDGEMYVRKLLSARLSGAQ